jgi:Fe-S cluster assembly scaffold protein SufB
MRWKEVLGDPSIRFAIGKSLRANGRRRCFVITSVRGECFLRSKKCIEPYLMDIHMNYIIKKHFTFIHTQTERDTEFNFYLEENAQLDCFILAADANLQQLTINIYLQGRNARASYKQLVMLNDATQYQITATQYHQAPDTHSSVIIKSTLAGQSQFTFEGLINIEKNAPRSRAVLNNKNILLSAHARAVAKPQLEVIPSDVQCKHGSAISRLDNNHLLYLQSRGMGEQAARRLLLEGFASDMLEVVDEKRRVDIVKKFVDLYDEKN